jgi:hypothetical protein
MDLNIGTVFWFASRAQGYVKKVGYTEEDRDSVLKSSAGGRPLLRRGGAEAAKAVGREEWNNFNKSKNKKADALRCSKRDCGRVAKGRCENIYCAKCCFEKQKRTGELCMAHRNSEAQELIPVPLKSTINRSDTYTRDYDAVEGVSRILLVGIGADEQLGGYGRHRTAFTQGGVTALAAELNKDLGRLWTRNLGRDDRCISDNGREAWFPFLDERVVELIQKLPLAEVLDLSKPPGEGDKAVLRNVATRLGLTSCSNLVKRAVQFGTRIAKDTNQQHMGSNRKGKGTLKVGSLGPRDEKLDNNIAGSVFGSK